MSDQKYNQKKYLKFFKTNASIRKIFSYGR